METHLDCSVSRQCEGKYHDLGQHHIVLWPEFILRRDTVAVVFSSDMLYKNFP